MTWKKSFNCYWSKLVLDNWSKSYELKKENMQVARCNGTHRCKISLLLIIKKYITLVNFKDLKGSQYSKY